MSSRMLVELLLLALVTLLLLPTSRRANCWQMNKFNDNYKQQFNENENDDLSEESQQMAAFFADTSSSGQATGALSSQCERINFSLCSSMAYNFTRSDNFFKDTSQVEASERAKLFEPLVRHHQQCSLHLLAYLCELLAPVCIKNDLSNKFEIFPCRPFCRRVKDECDDAIRAAAPDSLRSAARDEYFRAFDCDKLPFESNGVGPADPKGPCHALPSGVPIRRPQAPTPTTTITNTYEPFDGRESSIFHDSSPIDPKLIQPVRPIPKSTPATNQTASGFTVQQFGHHLALSLMSYSNLLSFITLICLLLVVNSKRIKRFRCYLTRRSSNASDRSNCSSSGSSSNSRRKFAAVPSLGQARKLQQPAALSPSSSSRSLVLVSVDGKRAKHKMVETGELLSSSLEPSKKLLQAGLDRRTLINVNGTLERQREQQNSARYHLMQSIGLSQAEDSNKHQYDYISVLKQNPPNQNGRSQMEFERSNFSQQAFRTQQGSGANSSMRSHTINEPQLYNNILLSSPSHQVLLFGSESQSVAELQTGSNRSQFPSAANTKANLSSQYANPICSMGPPTLGRRSTTNQMSSEPQQQHLNSIQQQLMAERQRSFQRRPSQSNSSAASPSRFQRANNTVAGPPTAPMAYVSSNVSSSASSSAGSSTSSFSPPESSSGNLLLANQFVQSPRRGL